ncbi:hypothetical protein BJ085DRAFT_27145 [Dimargaris cristalligena]|uniref:Uncharacterized protein n=1 Tax=Dimargaris cristalligena TaxID=215637 RepID=A0A4P9ZQG8_9FUNG|nr:hypothetical protein BJ085DRAFT_27145 [Dimargaris cristalligena]|eukprot:RKP35597.1 hypothetical protein BJ085DRAFT_27145 [Dimargaris cristalligena]
MLPNEPVSEAPTTAPACTITHPSSSASVFHYPNPAPSAPGLPAYARLTGLTHDPSEFPRPYGQAHRGGGVTSPYDHPLPNAPGQWKRNPTSVHLTTPYDYRAYQGHRPSTYESTALAPMSPAPPVSPHHSSGCTLPPTTWGSYHSPETAPSRRPEIPMFGHSGSASSSSSALNSPMAQISFSPGPPPSLTAASSTQARSSTTSTWRSMSSSISTRASRAARVRRRPRVENISETIATYQKILDSLHIQYSQIQGYDQQPQIPARFMGPLSSHPSNTNDQSISALHPPTNLPPEMVRSLYTLRDENYRLAWYYIQNRCESYKDAAIAVYMKLCQA